MLNAVRSLKLSVLSSPLPERGVLLGGSLTLHGKAVSLACFHGVNFRSQSWVLFTLQRPYIAFASKVCTVEKSCQVRRVKAVQDLSLRLGYGAEDSLSGKLSPSSGKEIKTDLVSFLFSSREVAIARGYRVYSRARLSRVFVCVHRPSYIKSSISSYLIIIFTMCKIIFTQR